MSDPLATYLQDHLAGAKHAIDLLENPRTRHAGQPLGQFAAAMLEEIEADRGLLRGLAESIAGGSSELKEMGAWLSEKISRAKLNDDANGFGTLEALEFLELGIHGKRLLWIALDVIGQRSSTARHGFCADRGARRDPGKTGGRTPPGNRANGLHTA
jgi:hypothetical protein